MEAVPNTNARNVAAGLLTGSGVSLWTALIVVGEVWAHSAPTSTAEAVYFHKGITCIGYFTAFQATAFALAFAGIPLFLVGYAIAPKKSIRVPAQPLVWGSFQFVADDPERFGLWSQLAGIIVTLFAIFTLGPTMVRLLLSAGVMFNVG